jgi:predicted O-methyltransferase YrrM
MNFKLMLEYLRYRACSVSEHSIHSPFIFDLTTQAIRTRDEITNQQKIEKCRKKQLADHSLIEVTDLGTAYGGNRHYRRSISSIARHSAKPLKYAQLLYRLSRFIKPDCIIEMGTSFGYSTMYLASGHPPARVITIEGCASTAAIAQKNFDDCGFSQIRLLVGNFDDLLPQLLAEHKPCLVFIDGNHQYEATLRYFNMLLQSCNENSVLIFDDIYWSREMKQSWQEIKMHPQVKATVDVFMFGMVFFRHGMTKQHFVIRY